LPSAGNVAGSGGIVGSDAKTCAGTATLIASPAVKPILRKILIVSSQLLWTPAAARLLFLDG
jgi:hypothetical protein